jgi:hypothetical protein
VREQSLDDLIGVRGGAAEAGYLSAIFWQIRLINGQWEHRVFMMVWPAINGLAASDTNFSDTYRRTVPAECEWGANADKSGEENKKEQAWAKYPRRACEPGGEAQPETRNSQSACFSRGE